MNALTTFPTLPTAAVARPSEPAAAAARESLAAFGGLSDEDTYGSAELATAVAARLSDLAGSLSDAGLRTQVADARTALRAVAAGNIEKRPAELRADLDRLVNTLAAAAAGKTGTERKALTTALTRIGEQAFVTHNSRQLLGPARVEVNAVAAVEPAAAPWAEAKGAPAAAPKAEAPPAPRADALTVATLWEALAAMWDEMADWLPFSRGGAAAPAPAVPVAAAGAPTTAQAAELAAGAQSALQRFLALPDDDAKASAALARKLAPRLWGLAEALPAGALRARVEAMGDGYADLVAGRAKAAPRQTAADLQALVGSLEAALPASQGRERVALQLTLGAIKAHAGAVVDARDAVGGARAA